MRKFSLNGSIANLQEINRLIYGQQYDRFYSVFDLLSNLHKFNARALKGIRKDDIKKTKTNLLVSIAWMMMIAERFYIDTEKVVWERFPYLCSYCSNCPCLCKKNKIKKRLTPKIDNSKKPKTISEFQEMFEQIYPPKTRSLTDAGMHLAEELGELSEAIHNYLGKHLRKQFIAIESELADYVSCFFGLISSLQIDLQKEVKHQYKENCYICHKTPCICTYSTIASFKS